MIEVIPAYSSLTIYFDIVSLYKKIERGRPIHSYVIEEAEASLSRYEPETVPPPPPVIIPVCYDPEFGIDLERIEKEKKIGIDEIIQIHTSQSYRVYMLGFLPGFPYMGEVNEKIAFPRKAVPVMVQPGSVGIAGRQTGIYPFVSPGGWQIIGRTPLKLFDPAKEGLTLLKAGDLVEFKSISRHEFANY